MNHTPTTAIFPTLPARNLNGRALTLPAEFGGAFNIAIIAFRRWHQTLVDAWFLFLNPLLAAYPDLRAYELPIIGRQYTLARPFIDGGMAFAIPDPAVRNRTLTVYADVQQVAAALQIPSTETITLLLVDRSGRIVWRDAGPATAQRAAGLAQTLATLLP